MMSRVSVTIISVILLWITLFGVVNAIDPVSLLDQELPPPPIHHMDSQPTTFTEVSSTTNSQVSLAQKAAQQASLAVDQSVVENASIESLATAAGQLSAEEQLLVSRMIPVPTTKDVLKPLKFMDPPTRKKLKKNLGPRGYPWPEKLQNALNTVQDAAKTRIDQIKRQSKWSKAAKQLVNELAIKKNKVTTHVQKLTQEIKQLLGKKKQIQNKQLQDKLVARLELTHNNLRKIRRQTHSIKKNEAAMMHHKEELAHALEGIKRSLALLKGMKRQRQFPTKGGAQKLLEKLGKFDPDLSHEAEADQVRQLMFPDAVLLSQDETMDDMDELQEE